MKDNFNFLYCFDENYNFQALTSMISLLDSVDEEINIYVIHTFKEFFDFVPEKILKHKNLNEFNVYKFEDYDHEFPNIDNVHISVATYFRLFIKNYIDNQISNLVFLDPDVICLANPISYLKEILFELKNSSYVIGARTEHTRGEKRIGVDGNYFNAGVMVIDFPKWIKNDLHNNLISKLNEISNNILQWDQDVLNSFFNGKYLELENKFNFKASSKSTKEYIDEIIFIHYIGSNKPWLTSGTFEKDSNFYHENYRKISNSSFHIEHKWKKGSIFDLFKAVINLKIFKIKKPFIYIFEFIKSLFL